MALLLAGPAMWRFPATTSTCSGGSTARSVVAENGASAAGPGATALTVLCPPAGVEGTVAGAATGVLLLLRYVASCSSFGGNQKSQSFTTTAASAINNSPSAMSIRLRCSSAAGGAGRDCRGVDRSKWFSELVSS